MNDNIEISIHINQVISIDKNLIHSMQSFAHMYYMTLKPDF